jgi:hypothetical protein
VNACTREGIDVNVMEGWFSLRSENSRVSRRVVLYYVELDFRSIANFIEFHALDRLIWLRFIAVRLVCHAEP